MGLSLRRVKRAVSELFKEADARGTGFREKHRAEFRASSGGICARDVAFTKWAKAAGIHPTGEWKLESLLYVAIGTAAHEVVQKYLGWKGIIYGSWECRYCGEVWLNQKSPGTCCGHLVDYIEYALVHPDKRIGINGEYGHCDGVIPLPWGHHFIIVEFKTAGLHIARARKKHGPTRSHEDQASVYGEMMNKGYVKVVKRGPPTADNHRGEIEWTEDAKLPPGRAVAILVIYIPRDSPKISKWIPLFRPIKKGVLRDVEKRVPKTMRQIRKGEVPPGRCQERSDARDEYGKWCPWTETCFSPDTDYLAERMYRKYRAAMKKNEPGKGRKQARNRS